MTTVDSPANPENPLLHKKQNSKLNTTHECTNVKSQATSNEQRDRLFADASIYEDFDKSQLFTVNGMTKVLNLLTWDLRDNSLLDEFNNRRDKNRPPTIFPCSLKLDGDAFKCLERITGADMPYLDAWLHLLSPSDVSKKTASSATPPISTKSSPATGFCFDTAEILNVPALGDSLHASDIPRRKLLTDYLFDEAQDLAMFSENTRTLKEAFELLQRLIKKRFDFLRKVVNVISAEIESFFELVPLLSNKAGTTEAGRWLVKTLLEKSRSMLDCAERWCILHIELDALEEASATYRSKMAELAKVKVECQRFAAKKDLDSLTELKSIYGSHATTLDRNQIAHEAAQKSQCELEQELAAHRNSVLNVSEQSLNALDVLIGVAEQHVAADFVIDPKHFCNYLHGILRKGEVGFESFQHASQIRSIISAYALREIQDDDRGLAWSDIVFNRTQICLEVARLAQANLKTQLMREVPYDEILSSHAEDIATHSYNRAAAVMSFKSLSSQMLLPQKRAALAQLHVRSSELIMARDQAIQKYHKRRDWLENGHTFH